MNMKKALFSLTIPMVFGVGLAAIAVAATGSDVTGSVKVVGVRDSANVVVSLEEVGKTSKTPSPTRHAVMDQKGFTFEPHVLPVVKGTTVEFLNSDKVRHNVYSPAASAKGFNLGTYPTGTAKNEQFDVAGVVPVLCNVHAEMSGFVVVLDTPYFATTDKFGRFAIKDVAPGKYLLRAWHEKAKPAQQEVTVATGSPTTVQLELSGRK